MTPEGRVKDKIDKLLKQYRVYAFKPVQTGMGKPGLDYFCCFRGWFFAIEAKAEGKRLTERQEITRNEILAAWGRVFVIAGVDTPEFEILESWLKDRASPH